MLKKLSRKHSHIEISIGLKLAASIEAVIRATTRDWEARRF